MSGDQGKIWTKAQVYIEDINQPFHVIFTTRHSLKGGVGGDIALDDYQIGACATSEGNIYK